jgi:hypothetical protein
MELSDSNLAHQRATCGGSGTNSAAPQDSEMELKTTMSLDQPTNSAKSSNRSQQPIDLGQWWSSSTTNLHCRNANTNDK